MERQERVYEMSRVSVTTSGGGIDHLVDVEEIMYAERFVLITHRDPGDASLIRSTFPYEHLVKIDTHMKPDMPLLTGEQETVQDEVGKPKDVTYRSSDRPTSMKTPPDGTVRDRLRELGITLTEAQDEE